MFIITLRCKLYNVLQTLANWVDPFVDDTGPPDEWFKEQGITLSELEFSAESITVALVSSHYDQKPFRCFCGKPAVDGYRVTMGYCEEHIRRPHS